MGRCRLRIARFIKISVLQHPVRVVSENYFHAAVAQGTHFADALVIIRIEFILCIGRFIIQRLRQIDHIAQQKFSAAVIHCQQQTLVVSRMARRGQTNCFAVAENIVFAVQRGKLIAEALQSLIGRLLHDDLCLGEIS